MCLCCSTRHMLCPLSHCAHAHGAGIIHAVARSYVRLHTMCVYAVYDYDYYYSRARVTSARVSCAYAMSSMGLCAYACVCLCPHTFTTCIPRELVYEIPAAQVSMLLLQQHLISRVCYAYTIRRYDGECFVLFNVQFVCICYAICYACVARHDYDGI